MLARDHWRCVACGDTATVADHIVRPEDGGAGLDPANLRALCRRCNLARHHPAEVIAGEPSSVRPTFGPGPASPIIQRDSISSARSVPYHTHRTGPRESDCVLLGNQTYRGPAGACSCGYTWPET